MNLLVVDDEPLIVEGLRAIIMKADTGFLQVETANDGIEALEILKSYHAHLIVTDIHMPGMTGLELIETAKREKLCDRFIILTGYDDFSFARQALRFQVLDYLLKPIDKEELIAALHKAVQHSKQEFKYSNNSDWKDSPITSIESSSILENKAVSETMCKILEYIHQHYMYDLSLEQVAEYIGLNPSYISAMFKRETGVNFIPYLHSYRVDKAQKLMNEYPKLAIDKIALQVGYENPRHFFKVFKKYSGLTPGQYRDIDTDGTMIQE